ADHYDIDLATNPDSASSKIKIALMEAVLKEVRKITSEKNVRLLVIIEPSIVDLTENYLFTYKDLQRFPDYRQDNLSHLADSMCARNEIDRIDLFDFFTKNSPGDLYFKDGDTHWNDRGQDLAAQVTAARLEGDIRNYLSNRVSRSTSNGAN